MTSQQFILWLRGFTEGVHEYNVTPKQWTLLKEKLAEVKDEPTYLSPIETRNPYSTPYKYDPYRVYCGDAGTGTPTPGFGVTAGYISPVTNTTPPYTITSASSFPGTITTTQGYDMTTFATSGSNITFTTNGSPNWYSTYFNDLKPDDNDR